jgi:hypothetical protein
MRIWSGEKEVIKYEAVLVDVDRNSMNNETGKVNVDVRQKVFHKPSYHCDICGKVGSRDDDVSHIETSRYFTVDYERLKLVLLNYKTPARLFCSRHLRPYVVFGPKWPLKLTGCQCELCLQEHTTEDPAHEPQT